MLNRMDVTEPPNSAPQYMLESRVIRDTVSNPKVSGSRRDTPFGAPRPGRTPTTMPSRTPISINRMCCSESAMVNPCRSASRFAMVLEPQGHAEETARQINLEDALEHQVQERQEQDRKRDALGMRPPSLDGDGTPHVQGRRNVHADQPDRGDEHRRRNEQPGEAHQPGGIEQD